MSALFLHIGEPKCATTYVQEVVWANQRELARRGVVLPGTSVQDHFQASQDVHAWDALARQATRADRAAALISHELFSGADDEQVARIRDTLRGTDLHLVVTVRDFASLLPAEWQETIKHRNVAPWQVWLDQIVAGTPDTDGRAPGGGRARWFWRVHDTAAVLGRWSRGLPPERVHVITVPRPGAPRSLLWQRFAGVLGVDPAGIATAGASANPSLGPTEVELLRRLNRRLPDDLPLSFYIREVKERLAQDVLARRPAAARVRIPADRFDWAAGQAERIIGQLTAAGYHIAGDLDDLRPQRSDTPYVAPTAIDSRELLDAALDALAALLVQQHRAGRGWRARRFAGELGARHPGAARLGLAVRTAARSRSRRSLV